MKKSGYMAEEKYTEHGLLITKLRLLLYHLIRKHEATKSTFAKDSPISYREWFVVSALYPDYYDGAPGTVPQISRKRDMRRQNVQTHVDRLREAGIVELVDNPDHRISKIVQLTDYGMMCARFLMNRATRRANKWGERLDMGELQITVEIIEELIKRHDGDSLETVMIEHKEDIQFAAWEKEWKKQQQRKTKPQKPRRPGRTKKR